MITIARQALEGHLIAISGIPSLIEFENILFKPDITQPYLRTITKVLSERNATLGVNPSVYSTGLFLVDCFQPFNEGPQPSEAMAELIQNNFKAGTQLVQSGKIVNIRFSQIGPSLEEDQYYMTPLTMTWYVYS